MKVSLEADKAENTLRAGSSTVILACPSPLTMTLGVMEPGPHNLFKDLKFLE